MNATKPRPETPRPSHLLGRLAVAVTTSLVQIAMGTLIGFWIDTVLGWMLFTPIGVCLGMALSTKTLLGFIKQNTPKVAPGSPLSYKTFDDPSDSMASEDSQESKGKSHA